MVKKKNKIRKEKERNEMERMKKTPNGSNLHHRRGCVEFSAAVKQNKRKGKCECGQWKSERASNKKIATITVQRPANTDSTNVRRRANSDFTQTKYTTNTHPNVSIARLDKYMVKHERNARALNTKSTPPTYSIHYDTHTILVYRETRQRHS